MLTTPDANVREHRYLRNFCPSNSVSTRVGSPYGVNTDLTVRSGRRGVRSVAWIISEFGAARFDYLTAC